MTSRERKRALPELIEMKRAGERIAMVTAYDAPGARAAEDAGYHAMTIADSIAYPFESDSTYPYTPDGNREFLDGKASVEAFGLAGALCAVTTRLRFNFFVL